MIGAMQWAITLARFDIAVAVATLSSFRVAPRKGHLERIQRIAGYLVKFKSAALRFRTEKPDYSNLPTLDMDWSRSVYGRVTEEIPAKGCSQAPGQVCGPHLLH